MGLAGLTLGVLVLRTGKVTATAGLGVRHE